MNGHKQSKHEGVIYICDKCDYRTSWEGDLKRHKNVKHEGVTYDCDLCDYKAAQPGDLRRHKKSKHEGTEIKVKQEDMSLDCA